MRDSIHLLKYDKMHPAARVLGRMLAEAIGQLAGDAPSEMLVIPVPLHRRKNAQRGFNQAHLLARRALAVLNRTHPGWKLTLAPRILFRLRATETQAGLTPRQRRTNLRGAFSVTDPSAVALKHILLIDDILTTGATARAAAMALMTAGAASVRVATLARARRANWSPGLGWDGGEIVKGYAASSQSPGQVSQNRRPATGVAARNLSRDDFDSHLGEPISSHDQPSF
jgi:ComF family protein